MNIGAFLVVVMIANATGNEEIDSYRGLAWRGAVMARLFRKEPHDTANFGWRILDKLSELFAAA